MADVFDTAKRSAVMARIKGRDTKPEMRLRRALHRRGLRFRLHGAKLPGRPDLVFARHRAVIFVHGCFWHRHPGCRYATTPATRREYWLPKFERNVERDARDLAALEALGWRAGVVWECALKAREAEATADAAEAWVRGAEARFEAP